MQYVCHNRFKGKAIDGSNVLVRQGKKLNRVGSMLYFEDTPICVWRSLVAKQHFSIDEDGEGLRRGRYTYALAYAPRYRRDDEDIRQQRFTDAELKTLNTRWNQYIKPNLDMLLFNDEFFELPVEKLKEIAESVNIDA